MSILFSLCTIDNQYPFILFVDCSQQDCNRYVAALTIKRLPTGYEWYLVPHDIFVKSSILSLSRQVTVTVLWLKCLSLALTEVN